MTADKSESKSAKPPRINPFLIPKREHMPKAALCPWRWADHTEFYVEVDNYADSLEIFDASFADPALLQENSRLVLVAGDSGCGKSALINHCVHLLAERLPSPLRAVPVDLTREVEDESGHEMVIDIPKRMSFIGDKLVKKLAAKNLIGEPVLGTLQGLGDRPHELHAELANALDSKENFDVVLLLLLPTMELVQEVEKYAALSGRRVVYFAESLLVRSQAEGLANSRGAEVPPVIMTVGTLNPGDVGKFVDARFEEARTRGDFPGLADELIEEFENGREMSIARLQQTLARIYMLAMKKGEKYASNWTISLREAQELLFHDTLEGNE